MGDAPARPSVVVGLGNPGERYVCTRHNVGRAVALQLVERLSPASVASHALMQCAEVVAGARLLRVVLPKTYMNESGRALAQLAELPEAGEILVVHDELDLPLGQIRLKIGGGDGGHRGLRSVTERVGANYARLRIGIGRPAETFVGTVADFVLEAVPLTDRPMLNDSIGRAVEATLLSADIGYAAAMNLVNQRAGAGSLLSALDRGPK